MKILILGGTRFTGKGLVQCLLTNGHQVVSISRRESISHSHLKTHVGERDAVLQSFDEAGFDRIIDFIAYDAIAVRTVKNKFPDTPYILISSCWLSQHEGNEKVREFSEGDQNYITQKLNAEHLINEIYLQNKSACAVRLPVTLGTADHTERFEFYKSRIETQSPILMIDGGQNTMQLTWKRDVAVALTAFIETQAPFPAPIIDALPDQMITLKIFVQTIAEALKTPCRFVDCDLAELKSYFSEYLTYEPFWRERAFPALNPNLFRITQNQPHTYSEWIHDTVLNSPEGYIRKRISEAETQFRHKEQEQAAIND